MKMMKMIYMMKMINMMKPTKTFYKILLIKVTDIPGVEVGCLFSGELDGDHDSEVFFSLRGFFLTQRYFFYSEVF